MTGAPVPDGADAIVMVERTAPPTATTAGRGRQPGGPGRATTCAGRGRPRGRRRRLRGRQRARPRPSRRARQPRPPDGHGRAPRPGRRDLDRRRARRDRGAARARPDPRLQPADAPGARGRGGLRAVDFGIGVDDEAAITERSRTRPARCDAMVTSGGGVGGRLRLREGGARAGSARRSSWWQVAIKPAKPLAFGMIGGVPIFGLPGQPGVVPRELRAVRPARRCGR